MTELAGIDRVAPGAVEAWRRHLGKEVDAESLRAELARGSLRRRSTRPQCATPIGSP
jgi:hypothetical protein